MLSFIGVARRRATELFHSLSTRLRARFVHTGDVRTLCVLAGPYRNLTTLTASVLSLHPGCQVLNHAGTRTLNDRKYDFWRYADPRTFGNFLRFAIAISGSGRRGSHGGSITLSHAFDSRYRLADIYRRRYGSAVVKERITCLVWKESMRITNHLREHAVDMGGLLHRHPALRFVLPVRNPLDCARSCMTTGHVRWFGRLAASETPTIEDVVEAVLDEFLWFLEQQDKTPDRFLWFFASDFGPSTLERIAEFLALDADQVWMENGLAAFAVESEYRHPPALVAHFEHVAKQRFSAHPEFLDGLLDYVDRMRALPSR